MRLPQRHPPSRELRALVRAPWRRGEPRLDRDVFAPRVPRSEQLVGVDQPQRVVIRLSEDLIEQAASVPGAPGTFASSPTSLRIERYTPSEVSTW
jgi:hypothetical protein